MIRTHADYGELLQKLSPPNRIIVAIGPDWDSEHPEEREMEVTIEGAWAFIEDTQGLGVPLDDWCNRVNIDLFSGTVYLSKANTTAFEIDELDEMADEVELNIESELLRIHSAMETWR